MKRKSLGAAGIIWSLILILTAVFGGFKLATDYKEKLLTENGVDRNSDRADGVDLPEGDKGTKAALTMTPINIALAVNTETGRIEHVLVEIFRAGSGQLDYIRIAPEVSYTMTSSLYTELIAANTELPQTVTLSEIYRYYHSDKAYDAMRRIVGEMLNTGILYYTATDIGTFEKFVSIHDTSAGFSAEFAVDREKAVSSDYGTPGSIKGVLETALEGAVTNWSVADRLRYLDVYELLDEESVCFTNAPVIELNETCELDSVGTGAILGRIL